MKIIINPSDDEWYFPENIKRSLESLGRGILAMNRLGKDFTLEVRLTKIHSLEETTNAE